MLKIDQIRKVACDAMMRERLFHASLLNTPGEEMTHGREGLYYESAKINAQAKSLVSGLNALHETLTDFVRGDFDKYIDRHTKFIEEGDEVFDPYEELSYLLNPPYSIYAIPETIIQYRELLCYVERHSQRKRRESEAFKTFFLGLSIHYTGTDAEGNRVLIPENQMDEETKLRLEANQEIRQIETEHCLDNYNLWYLKMKRGISGRLPFPELLTLFK